MSRTSRARVLSLAVLAFPHHAFAEMIGHAYDGYPLESCGLLIGTGSTVRRFVACTNEAASARVYTIPPRELLRAERAAEDDGLAVIGVFHSHTHSEPYPSPTDVAQAPDPEWHYVIVSLKRDAPETRSYRIVDGTVTEERVAAG
jgi:proteasome lid subunit RPN8/RPN11